MKAFVHTETKDVRLFSALAAMGFAWTESGAVEGGDRAWLFSQSSDCGKWNLGAMLKAWNNPSFHDKNPSHPFHHVKVALASDMALRRMFREGGGFRQVQRGEALATIGADQTPEESFNIHATPDVAFSAALSSAGFTLTRCGNRGRLGLIGASEASTTKPWTHQQVQEWWNDKGFCRDNPQHTFAYIKAALVTYVSAVGAIRRDKPLVRWSPPGSTGFAYIHPDCSQQTEGLVAGWLRGESTQ
jgi:hypothetical protein